MTVADTFVQLLACLGVHSNFLPEDGGMKTLEWVKTY
jgi:hypothetical protein